MDEQMNTNQIIEWVQKQPIILGVVLGGSRALGTHTSKSDYDVGVYLSEEPTIELIENLCASLSLENGIPARIFPTTERHFTMIGKSYYPQNQPEINLGFINFTRFKEALHSNMDHNLVLEIFHFIKNAKIVYDKTGEIEKIQKTANLDWAYKKMIQDLITLAKWDMTKYKAALGESIVAAQMLKNDLLWHIAKILAIINNVSIASRYEYKNLEKNAQNLILPENFVQRMNEAVHEDNPQKLELLLIQTETISKQF